MKQRINLAEGETTELGRNEKWVSALKAIVPALVTLLLVLFSWIDSGHLDAETLKLAVTGFLYAVIVYVVPNLPTGE